MVLNSLPNEIAMITPVDGVKRFISLAAQGSMVQLVISFKATPPKAPASLLIWTAAAVLGALTALLLPRLDVLATDGILLPPLETSSWWNVAYFSINLLAITATSVVCGFGCFMATRGGAQSGLARLSLNLGALAGVSGGLYAITGILALVDVLPTVQVTGTRQVLLLLVMVCCLSALLIGGGRKLYILLRLHLAIRTAINIVEPLWLATTLLHGEVVLMRNARASALEVLTRMVIETNDALHILRLDPDPALCHIRDEFPLDAQLLAGIIMHLLGDDAVGPLQKPRRKTTVLTLERWLHSPELATAVLEIRNVRIALDERNKWWDIWIQA